MVTAVQMCLWEVFLVMGREHQAFQTKIQAPGFAQVSQEQRHHRFQWRYFFATDSYPGVEYQNCETTIRTEVFRRMQVQDQQENRRETNNIKSRTEECIEKKEKFDDNTSAQKNVEGGIEPNKNQRFGERKTFN